MTAVRTSRSARIAIGSVVLLAALAGPLLAVPTAGAAPSSAPTADAPSGCDEPQGAVEELLECVTLEGVRRHLLAFQDIADANGGTRASGTPGYDASAEYVADEARRAGLDVTTQDVEFPFFELNSAAFAQVTPTSITYADGTDFATATFSGSGDVTGTAVPVDVVLPPTGGSTSGCEATDFAGFPPGEVALMQRGTCEFGVEGRQRGRSGRRRCGDLQRGRRTRPHRGRRGHVGRADRHPGRRHDVRDRGVVAEHRGRRLQMRRDQ